MAYDSLFDTLRRIETATNPHQFNAEWLRVLNDPTALSQLSGRSAPQLMSGIRSALQDTDIGYTPPAGGGGPSFIRGGTVSPFQPEQYAEPRAGESLSQRDALGNLRRLQVAADPFETLRQRNQFLSSPRAQGAAEGLRRRATGGRLNINLGQRGYNRLSDTNRQRLGGQASAFGLDPSQVRRRVARNTLSGGRQQRRSGYERLRS